MQVKALPFAGLIVAAALAVVTAGCSSGSSSQPSGSTTAGGGSTSAGPSAPGSTGGADANSPRYGGTLVIGTNAAPTTFNTNYAFDGNALYMVPNIYSKLVVTDYAKGEVHGDLAEKWQKSDDGKTYTFTLRPDLKWQDGKPLTSDDVVWTYKSIMDAGKSAFTYQYIASVESVTNPDPNTVVFALKTADAAFLASLSNYYAPVVLPKHVYEGTDALTNPANQKPVSSGPFQLSEAAPGDHYTMVPNPNYYGHKPYIDKLIFRVIPNRATAIQALRAGEIQFSQIEAPPAEVPGLKSTEGLSVQSVKLQEKIWLGLNLRDPILAKADVRKAMAMAINQKDINARVYKDLGITAVGPCLSYSEYCDPSLPMPKYDPAGANALLDQAGYPKKGDGMRFSITLSAWNVSEYGIAEMAQVVKQELSEVGIDLQVKMADFSLFSQQVVKDHNFQITTSGGLWGPDPSALEAFYSSTGGRNVMGFNDSEVDSLLAQARTESDQSKRKELYFAAEKRVTEALPIIPLIDYVGLYPVRTDTHGYWWEPAAAEAGIAEMMYNYVWMDSGTAQPASK